MPCDARPQAPADAPWFAGQQAWLQALELPKRPPGSPPQAPPVAPPQACGSAYAAVPQGLVGGSLQAARPLPGPPKTQPWPAEGPPQLLLFFFFNHPISSSPSSLASSPLLSVAALHHPPAGRRHLPAIALAPSRPPRPLRRRLHRPHGSLLEAFALARRTAPDAVPSPRHDDHVRPRPLLPLPFSPPPSCRSRRQDDADETLLANAPLPSESFDGIYLDLSKESGKCRFAETGFGWKPSAGGETFTLDHSKIGAAQWSRASRGYEVRILQRNSSAVIQLDGFRHEDLDRLAKIFKNWYTTVLENKEHAIRGWNWGKAEFSKADLTFSVQNKPAFEIPYSEIGNTNLAGRNEVAVELALPPKADDAANQDSAAAASTKGKKAGAGRDQLVEMRLYIPGVTTKKDADLSDDDGAAPAEEQNAATLFYDTLIEKAEIGEMAGDTIATFLDVLHLTPRGRFDIDMYQASFRLRGKTYDYKIQYEAIKKFMVLPKPDEMHCMLCIGLDPPLRQGQTRYPFVVMQFKKDEEVTIDLNMDEADLQSRYQDKLEAHYEEPLHHVVAKIFRGLANKKISSPAKDFITSVPLLFLLLPLLLPPSPPPFAPFSLNRR